VKSFKDRYPELEDRDIALVAIVGDLDHVGQMCRAATVPAQHDMRIVHALRERAAERASQDTSRWSPRFLFAQHRSLALVAVMTLSLIALVGGAYAAVSTLSSVFHMGAADNVLTQNLGTRVNQSQTVGGYTMTVERAYADSNRLIIAYTIRPPETGKRQWNLTPDNLKVVTASGVELPDRGYVVASDTGQPDATLQMFDTAGITGNPKILHLRLTVPWIDGMKQLAAPQTPTPQQLSAVGTDRGLPTTGQYGSIAIDPANAPNGVQDPYVHDFRVFGPLGFDIAVPFVAGREVNPHQPVNAGGVTLTLERVVISPTETRVYVSGLGPNRSQYVHGVLSGNGWTDESVDGGSTSVWYSNGMAVFSYLGSFTDKHGAWTLTVKSNPGPASTPPGPWTFHFTVP
jgi:hypothetical protein